MLLPGQILSPSDSDLELIGSQCADILDDLEREYRTLLTVDIPVWLKWHSARPRSTTKNFPFKDASNVVLPFIALMSDALVARTFGSIFGAGDRVWGVRTEREDLTKKAHNLERAANWSARNDFDFKLNIYDWLSELFPIGSSVLAINWRRDLRTIFFGPGSNDRARLRKQQVEFARGVTFDLVPREQILWDTRYRIGDAPVVAREHAYTQARLYQMAQQDPAWIKEAVEEIKGAEGTHSSVSYAAQETKNRLDSRTRDSFRDDEHDIRELHLDWPILRQMGFEDPSDPDPEAPNVPIVVHLHRTQRRVLRIVAEPYHLPHKPFFDGFFRKESGRGHGSGIAKKLEPLQSIMTTLYNQSIDAQTRANAIWAKTTDPRWQTTPIDPSHPLYVGSNIESFQPLNIGTSIQPNIALMTMANTFGERLIGISDPAFGRETRQGGHPSPATSTLALLEQTQQMATATLSLLREQVSRMGMAWAILTQQFETNEDGKLQRVFGATDAADIEDMLFPTEPIPLHYLFDVAAMSETLNPDTEMRRAVVVDQMSTAFWSFVLQGVQNIVQLPPGHPFAQAWTTAIDAKKNAFTRFLEAANIDDIERFTGELKQAVAGGAPEQLNRAAGLARELGAGAGAVQGAGPAGSLAPGANGRAAGMASPSGVLQ